MWEWIQTWTFFNWLAVVAFIFACISVTNAFLGLRARYRESNFYHIKNKKEFNKQKEILEKLLFEIKLYNSSPTKFFILLTQQATAPAYSLIASFMLTTIGLSMLAIFPDFTNFKVIAVLPFLGAFYFLKNPLFYLIELAFKLGYILNPQLLDDVLIEFAKYGKAHNLIEPDKMKNLISLVESLVEKSESKTNT